MSPVHLQMILILKLADPYPVLHLQLDKSTCQVGGGAQDKDQQTQGSESSADVQGACRDFFFRKSGSL